MKPEGEYRKVRHDLEGVQRATPKSGATVMAGCSCGHLSFGEGPLPEAHRQVLAAHMAHMAEMAACAHPNAATVEEPRVGAFGWVCPDCGDEFLFPDTMEGLSPEMRADMEALERTGSLPGLEHFTAPPIGEIRMRVQFSPEVKKAVWVRDGGRCRHCGMSDDRAVQTYGEHLHYDHIVPFSQNGANTEQNCQLLCRGCDLAKGNRFTG
jgi:HNH endonuclease